jgi:hypothetical protein
MREERAIARLGATVVLLGGLLVLGACSPVDLSDVGPTPRAAFATKTSQLPAGPAVLGVGLGVLRGQTLNRSSRCIRVQVESSDGMCPFLIEGDTESAHGQTAAHAALELDARVGNPMLTA